MAEWNENYPEWRNCVEIDTQVLFFKFMEFIGLWAQEMVKMVIQPSNNECDAPSKLKTWENNSIK